jgi:hypothetical protein
MALTNLGFGSMFNLNQPFSPTLARTNMTPGMMQLSPQPTPGGGAAPLYPSTANGIGGGAVPPGVAGAQSPGNILQQHPMTQFAQPAMFAAQPMVGQPGGGNAAPGGYQATLNGQVLGQPPQSGQMGGMSAMMQNMRPGLQLLGSAHQRPDTQAAQQAQTLQQIQAAQQLAQLLKQYNVSGLMGSGGGQ